MFKDEAGVKHIVEFVGLRAKLYSYKMLDASEDKKCKGVTKNFTKKGVFNSMTIESACLAGMINIEKWMSYEVMVIKFIPKKLIKLPSIMPMTNELLWLTEYTLWLMIIQT